MAVSQMMRRKLLTGVNETCIDTVEAETRPSSATKALLGVDGTSDARGPSGSLKDAFSSSTNATCVDISTNF